MLDFNSNSNDHLSALFFGGTLIEQVVEPALDAQGNVLVNKTGKNKGVVKTHKVERKIKIAGCGLLPEESWETEKAGVFKTNKHVLKKIISMSENGDRKQLDAILIAKNLLNIKRLRKLLKNYFNNLHPLIHPDGHVHCNYNHTSAGTGRLTSDKPNLQNIPK